MNSLQQWRDEMWQEELRRRGFTRAQEEFRKGEMATSANARETAFNVDRWLRRQLTHSR